MHVDADWLKKAEKDRDDRVQGQCSRNSRGAA
jgi:hypothetical protein